MNATPLNQTELVERVLDMTRQIEQAASLADWPEAARLTELRSPLLMSIAAQQEPAALAMIRTIQAIDADLLTEAHTTQDELQVEFDAAMSRTRAVSKYHQIARM